MTYCYLNLTAEDRAAIMMMRSTHLIRVIAGNLGHVSRTVSRELTRHTIDPINGYEVSLAGFRGRLTRHRPRQRPKLHPGGELFEVVVYLLRKYWFPKLIVYALKGISPSDSRRQISHEAIYYAVYVMPHGKLKKEIIAFLRQGNGIRRPRHRGKTSSEESRAGQHPSAATRYRKPA